jgi:uncharacterized repeat protein (TIGR01451 family)
VVIRWGRGLAVLALATLYAAGVPGPPAFADDPADLSVTVSGTSPAIPGAAVTWTATVANSGPAVAREVALTLAVPLAPGDALRSATSTIGPCTVAGTGTVTCDLGSIAVTGSIKVTATQTLASDHLRAPSATATVSAASTDADPANNSATAKSDPHPVADLWLTQSATGTNVVLGDPVTLVLTVVDLGPSAIPAGTRVVETLPTAVSFNPNGSSSGCTVSGAHVTCVLGQPLQVGTRGGTTLVLQGLALSSQGLAYSAVATPPAAVTDPDPGNNKAATANAIGRQADVGITTGGGTDGVAAGTSASFTYAVTNNGPGAATGVTVHEVLPEGLAFDSSASGCTAVDQTVTCPAIDAMPAGTTRTLTLNVQVEPDMAAGTTIRAARVTTTGAQDPNGSNQTGYAPIEVIRTANLALSAGRVGPAPVTAGTVTYELTVRNLGPASATGVTVTDRLPSEVTLGAATVPGGGTCAVAGDLHTCTLTDPLLPDGTQTIRVTGTVTGSTVGTTLTDSGYATAVETEADPSDNPATTTEIVQTAAPADRPRRPVSFHLGSGLSWLTWAGGGTVLFGLVLLLLAGRRMASARSTRTGGPLPPRG